MNLEELINASADLLDAGEAGQARVLSLRAIEIDPKCYQAWSNLAFAEIQRGELKAAEQAAKRAISIDPTYATAWHNLGEAYMRMGLAEKSFECNNRALTLAPGVAIFWLGKGTALMAMERYGEAVACFDKAISLNPQMTPAKLNREVSMLLSKPEMRKLLYVALGLAIEYSEGKINDKLLNEKLMAYFVPNTAFSTELIRSFDYFAQSNIQMGKPFIIHFCQINLTLSLLLKDAELPRLCMRTLTEAQSKFGIG
jgi:tetratricopeptide (TPR) repeat protein